MRGAGQCRRKAADMTHRAAEADGSSQPAYFEVAEQRRCLEAEAAYFEAIARHVGVK
jgi:hypothetical protein